MAPLHVVHEDGARDEADAQHQRDQLRCRVHVVDAAQLVPVHRQFYRRDQHAEDAEVRDVSCRADDFPVDLAARNVSYCASSNV